MKTALYFRDNVIASIIEKEGFCKKKLPAAIDVEKFIQITEKIQATIGGFEGKQNKIANVSFHSSFLDRNKKYKELVWQSFYEPLKTLVNHLFYDFKIVQINIFNKPPGTGYVCPHQNLSIVDERFHSSYSIWIPLQNIDNTNGRLQFIKSSHRKFEKYRSAEIYWRPLAVFEENLKNLPFVGVDIELGFFLIFDDSIVHYSEDNTSKNARIVLHCLSAPSQATCIYPKIKDNKVYLYKVSDDFWKYHTPGDDVELREIYDLVDYTTRDYDINTVINEINSQAICMDERK
jgi:hypothetical protein